MTLIQHLTEQYIESEMQYLMASPQMAAYRLNAMRDARDQLANAMATQGRKS